MPLDLPLPESADDLRTRWRAPKAEQPRLRARDAADALRISEAELVAAQCGLIARPLVMDIERLFEGLPAVGRVMALTRNDSCVHERKGAYEPARFGPMAGIVLGPDIDLRIFPKHWKHLYAVTDVNVDPARQSLQVFDATGTAVHKIFALDATDMAAWSNLVESLLPSVPTALAVDRPQTVERAVNGNPNRDALLADWAAIKDVHEFHGMLKRNEVDALQAMQLVDGVYTQPLTAAATNEMLMLAAERQVPIMVFVGNAGLIQIHTGHVHRVVRMDHWVNVLDPDFNLHLREDHIAHAFAVTKPTSDGPLHSVELFDRDGGRIATFFGKRKPGEPELESWRGIVAELPRQKA
ncbi:putative hemin transport protein [Dongia mobilis]|uniref:Putative hemin transport protein n=1 Tax=Dongia mobilis TaxID=578943 RepID=A0A4R6WJK1_9PROT|nr:ChuX/HutX family heme-like substrate-binding protein [Dongia mobilis]TDQ78798.1 putative hemin transport protein [Dongia mobilis]